MIAAEPGIGRHDAEQLDDTKRQVEAQLVMMELDPRRRSKVLEDFMEKYTAAGGDETTGTSVHAQIASWNKSPLIDVPSISLIAQKIELFAQ